MNFEEQLNIDLSSHNRPEVPVKVEWEIKVEEPTGIKKFLFGKYGKLDKEVTLSIDNIKLDDRLILSAPLEQLVFLRSQGQSGSELTFKLKELKTYCRVMVNPQKVADCEEREKAYADRKPYLLSFSVVLSDEKGNTIEIHDVLVRINLTPVHLEPSVKLVMEEDFTYSSEVALIEIGSIHLANPTPDLKYTPAIDMNLKLDINGSGSTVRIPHDAIHIGSESGSCDYEIRDLVPHDPRSMTVLGKEKIVLPIYLDMRKLSNPLVPKETLQVVCNWSYRHSYNQSEYLAGDRVIEPIEFLQDAQGAELIVNLLDQEGNVKERVSNGQCVTLPMIEFFAEGNTLIDRMFRLSNLATDTSRAGAGVRVSNMMITETVDGALM